MKRYHACICFLLCFMYCFVACGTPGQSSQPQAETAVGAYVERDISPAGMDVARYVVGLAATVAIDSSYGLVAYRQQAEGNWEYAEGWLANATGIETILEATFLDRETMLVWARLEDGVCCPIKLRQDGEWEVFSKALYEENARHDGEYYHVGLLPLQDGTVVASAYILYDEESFARTALYAANGEWLLDYEIGLPAMNVAQLDGALYMLNMWPELFTIGQGGERLEATGDTLLVEMGANVRIAADEETLALIGAGGIYRLESDRSLTRLLDGRGYSFGAHGDRVESFACVPGGYLVATDAGRLYEIRWDGSFAFEGVLRVFSLDKNPLLTQTVNVFRRNYPHIDVEVEIFENDIPLEDLLARLNVELLAGKGPDVLLLEGLPAESYARQGALLDLAPLLDTADMFPSLIEPFMEEGTLFMVPTGLNAYALVKQSGLPVLTFEELVERAMAEDGEKQQEIAQTIQQWQPLRDEEQLTILMDSSLQLFQTLWYGYAEQLVQDNALDTGKLVAFYDTCYAVMDKFQLWNPYWDMPNVQALFLPEDAYLLLDGSVQAVLDRQARYGIMTMDTMPQLLLMQAAEGFGFYSEGAELVPLSVGGQAAWVPLGVMGVPTNTAQPQNAALFIQTALSPEVQASMDTTYRSSLPVTQEGGHRQFLHAAGLMQEQLSEEAGFEYLYPSFVEGLTAPCMADQYSKSMVSMGTMGILTGEMDVAEAVECAQRALQVYLAEKW